MATAFSSIITKSRRHLNEPTASFWSDTELLDIIVEGVKDLWGAIVDLNQEHFLTNDATNVSIAASTTSLTGVPTDCFRVHLIEPRDLSSNVTGSQILFVPKDYNHADFAAARASAAVDPAGGLVMYYALVNAGAPVGAPTIEVAPKLTAALNLRLVYVPVLATSTYTIGTTNPIPGESDNALISWCVAWARAKEREDRSPDSEWLAMYATEKTNLRIRLTPRQTQEPEYVEALFEHLW